MPNKKFPHLEKALHSFVDALQTESLNHSEDVKELINDLAHNIHMDLKHFYNAVGAAEVGKISDSPKNNRSP